jgi:hypothetical protein
MVQDSNLKGIEATSIHAWVLNNSIKTETGVPLDFRNHRFLYDIYIDDSKFIVCEKAAQIGFTTFEILNSFWKAYNQGLDIIYVLPTATDVKDFAGGKVRFSRTKESRQVYNLLQRLMER